MLLSLATRLPWVLLTHSGPSSDSLFYYLGAKSIAAGHGYEILGHPTAFFPVGWPAFLGGIFLVTGPSFVVVKIVNLVLWAITTGLVYALGRRLGGRRVGVVAGGLVAFAPTMAVYAMRGSSENLFIPLLLGACLLLLTGGGRSPSLRRAALAGLLLGFAILVRSTALFLPLVLPLWLLLRRPRRESWQAALALGLTSCLVLVPWLVRNRVVMHTTALSTNGGYTVWMGANPNATGGFAPRLNKWAIRSAASETRQNSTLLNESISYVTGHPFDWLELIPAKATELMRWNPGPIKSDLTAQSGSNPRTGWQPRHLSGAEATLINGSMHHLWLFRLWYYSYWILGAVALALALTKRLPGAGLAALLVGFWIVFHSVFVIGEPRYMLSVTPLVAPALAWFLLAIPYEIGALSGRLARPGQPGSLRAEGR
ncbi:MAG: glycosyltransferase family 39 protein [Gaiellaceae bacterium]